MGPDRDSVPLPVGSTLGGKYQLTRVIGAGGMGAVYEAHNSWTNRRVAIKVLLAAHAQRPEVIERFTQEARTATLIAHPNIVDILDMGQDAETGVIFIVQELLEGMDLSRSLEQRGPYAPRDALPIVLPVMGALVAAHRRGIVHRDLKPENIFLARNAEGILVPKLIDFGISKLIDDAHTERRRTQTGTAIGTPQYMSPEQARGDRDVDGRSDVWSMGVVLYEMLSGKVPFEAPNYNLLIVQIITQAPTRIESVLPAVPARLAEVLHRALEPDRERRFGSMQDFLSELLASEASHVGREFSLAPHASTRDSAAGPGVDAAAVTVPNANATLTPPPWTAINERPQPARRSRTFTAALVVGVIATGVVGGLAVGLREDTSTRQQRPVTVIPSITRVATPTEPTPAVVPPAAQTPTLVAPEAPVPPPVRTPTTPVRTVRAPATAPVQRPRPASPPPPPRVVVEPRVAETPRPPPAPSRPPPTATAPPGRGRRSNNNAPILEVD